MSDLKEFWEEQHKINDKYCLDKNVWNINYTIIETLKERQGLFFWERGGKEFVLFQSKYQSKDNFLDDCIKIAKHYIIDFPNWLNYSEHFCQAQDFLDCLACLGQSKIKELEKLKKKGVKNE
jgi:hypothetical protein